MVFFGGLWDGTAPSPSPSVMRQAKAAAGLIGGVDGGGETKDRLIGEAGTATVAETNHKQGGCGIRAGCSFPPDATTHTLSVVAYVLFVVTRRLMESCASAHAVGTCARCEVSSRSQISG